MYTCRYYFPAVVELNLTSKNSSRGLRYWRTVKRVNPFIEYLHSPFSSRYWRTQRADYACLFTRSWRITRKFNIRTIPTKYYSTHFNLIHRNANNLLKGDPAFLMRIGSVENAIKLWWIMSLHCPSNPTNLVYLLSSSTKNSRVHTPPTKDDAHNLLAFRAVFSFNYSVACLPTVVALLFQM